MQASPKLLLDPRAAMCYGFIQYRYSIGESMPGTAPPGEVRCESATGEASMNIQIHSRFVWRGGLILAIVFLTLAAPGRASAQGCTGVATSATGTVTWTPLWCQEFNATVAGPPDTMVWNFDLGNNGGCGNGELDP